MRDTTSDEDGRSASPETSPVRPVSPEVRKIEGLIHIEFRFLQQANIDVMVVNKIVQLSLLVADAVGIPETNPNIIPSSRTPIHAWWILKE